MQGSTPFNWGRVVTVLRWVARVVGAVSAIGLVLWMLISFSQEPGGTPNIREPAQWAIWGMLGVGLVLAFLGDILWKGVGEVVGGLLLVGAGVWMGFRYLPPQAGALEAGAVFAVPGVLFIICGWYTLAHRRSSQAHVAHTPT